MLVDVLVKSPQKSHILIQVAHNNFPEYQHDLLWAIHRFTPSGLTAQAIQDIYLNALDEQVEAIYIVAPNNVIVQQIVRYITNVRC